MEVRPIPALYCCYLLRSRPSPTALYVGSTPNPPRRLQQHNGKGGAVRTRRKTLRPWEMNCIVTGFPSQIAALQFEWAWQNTHLTKRIPDGERITACPMAKKDRRGRKRIPRPHFTMEDRLQNLHLLLRVPSFARWPLNVRFFCERLWAEWQQATEDLSLKGPIHSGINIVLDLKQTDPEAERNKGPLSTHEKGKRRKDAVGKGGLDGVDVGYSRIKDHLEKSMALFAGNQAIINCTICASEINSPGDMAVTCPHNSCGAACHLTCLANRFLRDEEAGGLLLPTSGHCPTCKKDIHWADLVKEMSLRAKGAKEVARLTKQSKLKRTQTAKASISARPGAASDSSEDDEEVPDDPLPDDWLPQDDDSEDGMSVATSASEAPSPVNKRTAKRLPPVIEDSEWDEAQVLG